MKSFGELTKEQLKRENDLLSHLMEETEIEELANFEAELSERRSEILFKITTEMEDTENALKQANQLVQRLKKHLEQLKDLQRALSKQY
mgnify:CR=1 FL=1